MNLLSIADQARKPELSLEDKLQEMRRLGKPRLSFMTDGWCATIDMHVAVSGTSCEVRSDFDHKTPSAAINLCTERVFEMLQRLK